MISGRITTDVVSVITNGIFQLDMGSEHCVRGHGLGLAGVAVLVEDMKGSLSLQSDTGVGATFTVTVPYQA